MTIKVENRASFLNSISQDISRKKDKNSDTELGVKQKNSEIDKNIMNFYH